MAGAKATVNKIPIATLMDIEIDLLPKNGAILIKAMIRTSGIINPEIQDCSISVLSSITNGQTNSDLINQRRKVAEHLLHEVHQYSQHPRTRK